MVGKGKISKNGAAARREYMRQWRKKNPDKVRATQNRYWERRYKRMQEDTDGKNEQ